MAMRMHPRQLYSFQVVEHMSSASGPSRVTSESYPTLVVGLKSYRLPISALSDIKQVVARLLTLGLFTRQLC